MEDDPNCPDIDMTPIRNMEHLEHFNIYLNSVGEIPMRITNLNSTYIIEKVRQTSGAVKRRLLSLVNHDENLSEKESEEERDSRYFMELIDKMIEKFKACQDKSEQIQLLTMLPEDWTIVKVMKVFGATCHQVRVSKQLVKDRGFHEKPALRKKRETDCDIPLLVVLFFLQEISREMPGRAG